ncbi:DapH/DapD/GlmU-related protein [Pedobacter agri]|uniref:DapH/DapD/GlmU-related protein n=1 Tax=Pedobacter agri TaxID=454586 RepID=UPI00277E176B|nr:DapH/DapD/GlmU-related protein [Pedobacter agri]MDQ1141166.1 acetyltransferase-like isoleucine patch superfamily enzyme [Pedobacter agri]
MINPLIFFYKAVRETKFHVVPVYSSLITRLVMSLNGVKYGSIRSTGVPHVHISLHGECEFGDNMVMGNWIGSYATGLLGKCRIEVRNGAKLKVGYNVGITLTTIVCHQQITIGNNVNIGVGVHIYDTDFHSLDPNLRSNPATDWENKKTRPVLIEDNVFVGAQSIILKGVTIGKNSVIGAGSVVTRDIPANVIAGGNPCKILKNLN